MRSDNNSDQELIRALKITNDIFPQNLISALICLHPSVFRYVPEEVLRDYQKNSERFRLMNYLEEVRALPPLQQTILHRFFIDNWTTEEIANPIRATAESIQKDLVDTLKGINAAELFFVTVSEAVPLRSSYMVSHAKPLRWTYIGSNRENAPEKDAAYEDIISYARSVSEHDLMSATGSVMRVGTAIRMIGNKIAEEEGRWRHITLYDIAILGLPELRTLHSIGPGTIVQLEKCMKVFGFVYEDLQ